MVQLKMNCTLAALATAMFYYYLKFGKSKKVSIAGKTAVITGATSGIGEACARKFHELGCNVIITGRNIIKLNDLEKELCLNNDRIKVTAHQLDVSDEQSVDKFADFVNKNYPNGIDILLNNAGVSYRGTIETTTLQTHKQIMEVNYFGQVNLVNQLLPGMKKGYETRNYKRFIACVSSTQGKISLPFRSAYSASKFACQSFYDCLRSELSQCAINVGIFSPGYVNTNLSLNAKTSDGSVYGKMDENKKTGFEPEFIALRISQMIEFEEKDVLLDTMKSKIAIILRFFTPNIYFWIMAKRAKSKTGL